MVERVGVRVNRGGTLNLGAAFRQERSIPKTC
jgi:hypothetical protein